MGDSTVRVVLGVVLNLEVLVVLKASCGDKFAESILPSERMIFPYNSEPVQILGI